MPGNELAVCKFLVESLGSIELTHLGKIRTVGAPTSGGPGFTYITNIEQLGIISPGDARKKADIYINGAGVSLKQTGGSFLYNRLQRANIYEVYNLLNFLNIDAKLGQIDAEVNKFHQGLLNRRNRNWQGFFSENGFKILLETLMMKYSPNVGFSAHPAELILEAPAKGISTGYISVFTFDEYFNQYKDKIKIAIRRQYVGQDSKSEHSRALSLLKKPGNKPWVFNNVAGSPSSGWRDDYPPNKRKTVYFLMIEKEA